MKKSTIALLALALSGAAFAKLPPPSPEAQAAADAAKAKAAWSDKVAAFKLCQVQNKIAEQYHKTKGGKPSADTPACTDPGPYVPAQAAATPASSEAAKPASAEAAKPASAEEAKPETPTAKK
jgi:hypothetical protein